MRGGAEAPRLWSALRIGAEEHEVLDLRVLRKLGEETLHEVKRVRAY